MRYVRGGGGWGRGECNVTQPLGEWVVIEGIVRSDVTCTMVLHHRALYLLLLNSQARTIYVMVE